MISLLLALAVGSSAPYTCTQTTTNDLIGCAVEKYRSADAALNSLWKSREHPPKVLKAQRAWLAYRDAECEAQNSASPDGSLYQVFKYLCLAELTDQRVEQLREIANR